jgi:hypothetical protein
MKRRSLLLSVCVVGLTSAMAVTSRPASADPQTSVALTIGGGAADLRTSPRPVFHLGGWADILFFRNRESDMALGPYLSVDTAAFDTFHVGGGLSWLLPLGSPVLIVSGGALAQKSAFGWEPALQTALFFGSRSFNFHSVYGFAIGGFVQGRLGVGGLDGTRQADVVGGLQMDVAILGLPFVLLYQGLRGRPATIR